MKAILKFIGETYWPWPQDHIKETRERGPSIRISPDSIPDIEKPYPVFFVHPRGTFTINANGMDIEDLFIEFLLEDRLSPITDRNDYIHDGLPTLAFISVFRNLDNWDQDEFNRLVDKYQIKFHYAITHYSYITGNQVVIGDDGIGLDLVGLMERKGIKVEPVKVHRIEDSDEDS